jgi:hypothetical protein
MESLLDWTAEGLKLYYHLKMIFGFAYQIIV